MGQALGAVGDQINHRALLGSEQVQPVDDQIP
jgi:hypothetical protein